MSAAPARLNLATAALLLVPPLVWAGNAVVGRLMHGTVPPSTLNFLRWSLALLILLPLAAWVLRPGSNLWRHWRRFALLGALGVGSYNALQYLALTTSTPLNVTLVAASMPVFMLLIGRVVYGVPVSRRAAFGAALSLCGVAVVLARGSLANLLAVRFVPGDGWILLATVVWACYSWLLVRPPEGGDPPDIKADWAAFLLAQVAMGLVWSGLLASAEWLYLPAGTRIDWGWPLVIALAYLAIFPSVLAYRCWGAGVARVGPTIASFFTNLTPLFAAVMSAALLGESPRLHHGVGFVLIVGGILISSRR
ncbi:MAG: DMT family transporter [Hydrogenophaga sp.]|nr:DMT family transporter [Hydrogenophaga sp.]